MSKNRGIGTLNINNVRKEKKMKSLILLFVLAPAVALAEDCSCLEQKVITEACWEWSLTEDAYECLEESDTSKRLTALEEAVKTLQAQVSKIAKKAALRVRK